MNKFIAAGLSLLIGAGIQISIVAAEPLGKNYKEILEAASREGKLVVWSTLPSQPVSQQALIEAFNARFGLKTRLEWVPMYGPTAMTRAISEGAASNVSVDIIGGVSAAEIVTANDAGLLRSFDWAGAFGKELPAIGKVEDNMVAELKGKALTYMVGHYVIGWNPNFISDADVPDTIAGLASPKFKSQVVWSMFGPLEIYGLAVGKDKALALADQFVANQTIFVRGSGPVNQAITSGQAKFGLNLSILADNSIRKGEPMKYKFPSDEILANDVMLFVPEKSPNPNTARLFAAWLATEGYTIANKTEPFPNELDKDNVFIKTVEEYTSAKKAKVTKVRTLDDIKVSLDIRKAAVTKFGGN